MRPQEECDEVRARVGHRHRNSPKWPVRVNFARHYQCHKKSNEEFHGRQCDGPEAPRQIGMYTSGFVAMPRPRFSLRTLLTAAVLVALVGYFLDLPRQNATRFAALVNAGEYGKAETMFGERVGLVGKPTIFGEFRATLDNQTFDDWLRGRYPMTVASTADGVTYVLAVDATPTGVVRSDRWGVDALP